MADPGWFPGWMTEPRKRLFHAECCGMLLAVLSEKLPRGVSRDAERGKTRDQRRHNQDKDRDLQQAPGLEGVHCGNDGRERPRAEVRQENPERQPCEHYRGTAGGDLPQHGPAPRADTAVDCGL